MTYGIVLSQNQQYLSHVMTFPSVALSNKDEKSCLLIVGHPEPEKKNYVGIFEYILASMLKVYLDVF